MIGDRRGGGLGERVGVGVRREQGCRTDSSTVPISSLLRTGFAACVRKKTDAGFKLSARSTRFLSDHWAPIDFASELKRDFACIERILDLSVGEQLSRCMSRGEGDLHFLPDRVKTVSRDCVYYRNKRRSSGQAGIRLIDEVERLIML